MAFNYVALRDKTAYKALQQFGTSGTLIKETKGAYNAGTGVQAISTANHPITLVLDEQDDVYRGGVLVKEASISAYISAKDLSVIPSIGDDIQANGVTYKITKVRKIKPSTVTVIYIVGLEI